ncbi:MAG: hypothetical protein HY941_13570 [Gammaproteobacteria bacterium]|nr:hypothetical protein [Gammaproteobacteria bacterium]
MSTETPLNVDALLKLADARKADNRLIVVFSDSKYLGVLLNWLIPLHRLGIRNYLIVALDETIHAFLTERGFPSVLIEMDGPLEKLWHLRLVVLRELCAHGIDLIHSDIDALWLRNPIAEYFSKDADDLVISQGTAWPYEVVTRQGFVLCCGLFYLRSGPLSLALLDDLLRHIVLTNDDQTSLNYLLHGCITWDRQLQNPYTFTFRGYTVTCSEAPIRGRHEKTGFTVTLLPHHLFQRFHMPEREAYVKHLFSEKTDQDKFESFKQSGCLFLDEHWKDIAFDAESIEKIAIHTPSHA